jgi:hypothetical protein
MLVRLVAGVLRASGGFAEMAQIPGVHIETIRNPTLYTVEQIEQACRIAAQLNRGKLCLVEKPSGWQPPEEDES